MLFLRVFLGFSFQKDRGKEGHGLNPPLSTENPSEIKVFWVWPTPESLISVYLGPFRFVSGPFGSVCVRFGSVSGAFRVCFGGVGVGSGRGASVKEKNITTLRFKGEMSNFDAQNTINLGKMLPKGQIVPFSRMYSSKSEECIDVLFLLPSQQEKHAYSFLWFGT